MSIENLVLLIIAGINLILGLVVFLKNPKRSLNVWFALLMLGVTAWSVGLAFSRELAGSFEALNWSRSTYFSSLFMGFCLLNFSYSYPFSAKKSLITKLLIWLPIMAGFLIMLIWPNFIIKEMVVRPWGYDNLYSANYLTFSLLLIYYFTWSFVNFMKNYARQEGIVKKQLGLIILSLGFATVFGVIFDLVLPYFNNWKFNWFGPYFTISVSIMIYYLLKEDLNREI